MKHYKAYDQHGNIITIREQRPLTLNGALYQICGCLLLLAAACTALAVLL